MDVPVNTFMTLKEGEAMSVEQVPNPEVPGAVLANGGNGGGGGGGGSSNSNSHNHTAAVSVQESGRSSRNWRGRFPKSSRVAVRHADPYLQLSEGAGVMAIQAHRNLSGEALGRSDPGLVAAGSPIRTAITPVAAEVRRFRPRRRGRS